MLHRIEIEKKKWSFIISIQNKPISPEMLLSDSKMKRL